jgi:hypothetical protein
LSDDGLSSQKTGIQNWDELHEENEVMNPLPDLHPQLILAVENVTKKLLKKKKKKKKKKRK